MPMSNPKQSLLCLSFVTLVVSPASCRAGAFVTTSPCCRLVMPKLGRRRTAASQQRALSSSPKSSTSNKNSFDLADSIVQELHVQANPQTKAWFTNYVKNTEWIGCKVPTVRQVVQDVLRPSKNSNKKKSSNKKKNSTKTTSTTSSTDVNYLLDNGIHLLQHAACDAKLGGMILLSEELSLDQLASHAVLDRLDKDIWTKNNSINDWSSADWLAARVLTKIGMLSGQHDLAQRILAYATRSATESSLWQRRCGVVSFLQFHKHRDKLPTDFGGQLIQACERSLLCSPQERFTQTGIAWVLRYVLLQQSTTQEKEEQVAALDMICRNGSLWTTEAKKSLVEKLDTKDPRRKQILSLS